MRIFYDYQAFSIDNKFGGIARCFIEVIKRMPCSTYTSILFSKLYYIHDIKPFIHDCFGNYTFKGKRRIRSFINKYYTYFNLFFKKYDLVHLTGEIIYPSSLIKVPTVITIHDCVLEKIFRQGKASPKRLNAMKRANHIIAVSHNTKNDILYYYPNISPNKISVIYHGVNDFKANDIPNLNGRYILYIGTRQSYKNFDGLINALKPILKEDKDLKLLCAGNFFNKKEKEFINQTSLSDRILSIKCNDSQLTSLYKYALAFIYPSLYEGFGIPILEAWQLKCPVVLSNTSCFPEIAGNAGEYFVPTDHKSIETAIRNVIYNNKRRKELIALGEQRLKLFSWDKATNELFCLYSNILHLNGSEEENFLIQKHQ